MIPLSNRERGWQNRKNKLAATREATWSRNETDLDVSRGKGVWRK